MNENEIEIDYIVRETSYPFATKQEVIGELVRCKDCKYRIINEHYGERGYLNLKAYCDLDSGDPFALGRIAEDDNWFCADGERRSDDTR